MKTASGAQRCARPGFALLQHLCPRMVTGKVRCLAMSMAVLGSALFAAAPVSALDCGRAETVSEKAICSNAAAREADNALEDAFVALRRAIPLTKRDALVADEAHWIKTRDEHCLAAASSQLTACLRDETNERVAYLKREMAKVNPNLPANANAFIKKHLQLESYRAVPVHLSSDGQPEIIVYALDECGTGGCELYVLKSHGGTFTVVAEIGVTHAPIRVLATSTHGWRDLSFWASGGGEPHPHEAQLRFNGKTYPDNPVAIPDHGITGQVVINDE